MRSARSMRLMADFAMACGVSLADCLAGTGVAAECLSDTSKLVTGTQELQLIANIVQRIGDVPGLGLAAGQLYHCTSFGILGLAMMSSTSMRSAFDTVRRYYALTFAFTEIQVTDRNDETYVVLDDSAIPPALRRFVVERDVAAMVTIQRELFSARMPMKRIAFCFEAGGQESRYQSMFGISPVFGATAHVAVFDRALLQLPLPQKNELSYSAAEEQCRRMLAERSATPLSTLTQVRALLQEQTRELPDMEVVAGQLRMTSRTLRRHQQCANTSFKAIRDEHLAALAKDMMASSALSVQQVSERLGYADATSFINAFKRWTGQTPRAYRTANGAHGFVD